MGICFASHTQDHDSNFRASSTPGVSYNNRDSIGVLEALIEGLEDKHLNGEILDTPNLKVFSFADLKAATRNFREDTVVGEGGFGRVFKGLINEKLLLPNKLGSGTSMPVAIKKLRSESLQAFKQWQSEINFLGRISHPNLVKIFGYCWEDKDLLLVYEFMQKGSLENHLFRRNFAVDPLPWDIRIKVAIGAARGLDYLHSLKQQIIHRDFKTSNILLDSDYSAKLSDFGLAKRGPSGGNSHVSTRVMGTYGYAAPEYIARGHLYVKSDVYGFGVVLLELLTGSRAMDSNRPHGQHNLVEWAKPFFTQKRRMNFFMDASIKGQYSPEAALRTAELALKCVETDHTSRPSMNQVVEALESIQKIKKQLEE